MSIYTFMDEIHPPIFGEKWVSMSWRLDVIGTFGHVFCVILTLTEIVIRMLKCVSDKNELSKRKLVFINKIFVFGKAEVFPTIAVLLLIITWNFKKIESLEFLLKKKSLKKKRTFGKMKTNHPKRLNFLKRAFFCYTGLYSFEKCVMLQKLHNKPSKFSSMRKILQTWKFSKNINKEAKIELIVVRKSLNVF